MLRRLADALLLLTDPPVFTIAFGPEGARVVRGRVPPALFADCADVAEQFGLVTGAVHGVRRGRNVALRFSRVPAECQQRFRNVLGVHAAAVR